MSYILNDSALAAKVSNLILVDEDDESTIVDIGHSPATLVVDQHVTIQAMPWNSVARKAFQTAQNGEFNFYGITFSANAPQLKHGPGEGGNTTIYIFSRGDTGGGIGFCCYSSFGYGLAIRPSSGVPMAQRAAGGGTNFFGDEGFTATDFSERIIVAISHAYADRNQIFSDVDGGVDEAFEFDAEDVGTASAGATISTIGGASGQGNCAMRMLALINFDSLLSLSEIAAIRDDWFGQLVTSNGNTVALGQATETSQALAVRPQRAVAMAAAEEANSAALMAPPVSKALTRSGETNLALATHLNGSLLYLDSAHGRELRDETGGLYPSVAGWKYAWYDDSDGPLNGSPVVQSGTFDTDAAGNVTPPLHIAATSLISGETGALCVKHPAFANVQMWWKLPIGLSGS